MIRTRRVGIALLALLALFLGPFRAGATTVQNPQTGDYTLALGDVGTVLPFNCAATCTATIPASTFSAGNQIILENQSPQGTLLILTPTSPVTITGAVLDGSGNLIIFPYQNATMNIDASGNANILMGGLPVPNINVVSGTTYTLTSTDCQNTVETTNASPVTITIPTGLPPCYIHIIPIGFGQVTVVAAVGFFLASSHAYTHPFSQYSEIIMHITSSTAGEFLGDGS